MQSAMVHEPEKYCTKVIACVLLDDAPPIRLAETHLLTIVMDRDAMVRTSEYPVFTRKIAVLVSTSVSDSSNKR